ncbi:putative disease resistance RPP13-like protein 1 [Amaranthus tricolor]|uniref:putative disease resistance RPP13-like protein 1 n=1 Tax=Amaranthus tricolor TaxID=29722 RepID=UPI00258A51B4|nr:putative disease resistance RPP13-like protein 1 [Amaranthus tricolor]
MAEIFVSAFVQVVFDKMASGGINMYLNMQKNRKRTRMIFQDWQRKLKLIEAVVRDAERTQFHSNSVKLWLQQLQDLAYDLEDIFDDFSIDNSHHLHELMIDDDSHVGCTCSPFHKVPNMFTCASGASHQDSAKYKRSIKQISKRLQDLVSDSSSLGLSQLMQLTEQPRQQRPETSSLVYEPVIYGRCDEKKEIIRRLLSDEPSYGSYIVIPIVGNGGIGKTTLAQTVYNNEKVNAHFQIKAWVCVSDVFDVKQITTSILNSATHKAHNFNQLNEAHEKLKNLVRNKRFLIVLDDIWNEEYDPWDQLQTPFQYANKGSRVIITTRIDRVAKNMLKAPIQLSPIISLRGLSDDDCWLLFQKHLLVESNIIEMKKEVVVLCKGLPLAAKALGGLLRKEDKSQWPKILKSNVWSEKGGVLPVLRLSYHHLPHHLKHIFAYCSIFPKDFQFEEKEIVLMWMAEGFVVEDEEESMEEKGRNHFLDLVSRSLFEPSPSHEGFFIMHDLVHDLAQGVASNVSCTMGINEFSSRCRYFSFSPQALEVQSLSNLDKVSQLRTFSFFGSTNTGNPTLVPDSIFQKMRYLHLLSIANIGITDLPNSIGNLKHLRLLNLSFNPRLVQLPESISNLCNLQTLLLGHCKSLKKIVTNMERLTKLRHLDIRRTTSLLEMPLGIEKLTKLRTLNKFFFTSETGKRINELRNLINLRGSISISGLENVVYKDAQEAMLYEKSGLDVLFLTWGTSPSNKVNHSNERDVLEVLKPPSSIQQVSLQGYRALAFPTWIGDPSFMNMTTLSLTNCLKSEYFHSYLPSLKKLTIENCNELRVILENCFFLEDLFIEGCKELSTTSPIISCSQRICLRDVSQFNNIEAFWVQGLTYLTVVNETKEKNSKWSMMKGISLVNCPKVKNLAGFGECNNLTDVELGNCEELVSLENFCGSSLRFLKIDGIQSLKNISSIINGIVCIRILQIKDVKIEQAIQEWGFDMLSSLYELKVIRTGISTDSVESISGNGDDLCLPSSLSRLTIEGFKNLRVVSCSCFPNLSSISIINCPKLESLGVDFPPTKISTMVANSWLCPIFIEDCPLIYDRCLFDPNGILYIRGGRYSYV